MRKHQPLEQRFWKHVYKTDTCWFWVGCIQPQTGYGVMGCGGRKNNRSTHHIAWFLAYGFWPKYLLHTCDTRQCVRPDHLKEGTQTSNVLDAASKGVMGGTMFKELCKNGHVRTAENLQHGRYRYCKGCRKMWKLKYRLERKLHSDSGNLNQTGPSAVQHSESASHR